jgi:hypothetical protein
MIARVPGYTPVMADAEEPASAHHDRPGPPRRRGPVGGRVYLRPPSAEDRSEFLTRARKSRALHRPWIDAPEDDEAFSAYLERCPTSIDGSLVRRREDDAIAGVINVSNIVLFGLRSAALGYYSFEPFAGQGYMARPAPGAPASVRRARAPPAGGEYPARQHPVDRAGEGRRVPVRGLLPSVPEDRRTLEGPRALGDPGRGSPRHTITEAHGLGPRNVWLSPSVRCTLSQP